VSKKRWDLKNIKTEKSLLGIEANAVAAYLVQNGAESFDDWQIAPEGTNSWRPCSQIPALRLIPYGLPPIPGSLGFSSEQLDWLESVLPKKSAHHQSTDEDLFLIETPQPGDGLPEGRVIPNSEQPQPPTGPERAANFHERRRETRFQKRMQVVLISDRNAFRTFTQNVSLGGFRLEHEVPPEFMGIDCTIFLTDPGSTQKLKLSGQLQKDPGESRRFVFSKMSDQDQQTLKSWITPNCNDSNSAKAAA